jgi:hypothetical protein
MLLALVLPARAQTTFDCSSVSGTNCALSVSAGSPGQTSSNSSTLQVSGATGTVASVQVVLNGVKSSAANGHQSMLWASFMLQGPGGQELEFLGATGDGNDGGGLNGLNITVADGSPAAPLSAWPRTGSTPVGPSSYYGWYGLPPQGTPANWPQTDGSPGATFNSSNGQFSGASANGTWTLILEDNDPTGPGPDPVSITDWQLILTYNTGAGTNTAIMVNQNPSFTSGANSSVTITATVTSSENPVTTGTVAFTDTLLGGSATTISGCGAVSLNSQGKATCTTTFTNEGNQTLQAVYSGSASYASGYSPTINQFVKNHSTNTGNTYCNPGAISMPGVPGNQPIYPSVINVGTLSGSVNNVEVTFKNISGPQGLLEGRFLLVAPGANGANNLDFMDLVENNPQPAVTVNFADNNPAPPYGDTSATLTNGATYEATDGSQTATVFPSPISPASTTEPFPTTVNYAQPFGGINALNFAQAFGGISGTGDWALYPYNNGGTDENVSIANGWCLTFTLNTGAATTTTVSSGTNPARTGTSVTITATVTSNHTAITSGTVTFTENGSPPAGVSTNTVSLNGSGQASITTSSLTEGDHKIVANYNGVSNTYSQSFGSVVQRIDNSSVITGGTGALNTNPVEFCNTGQILSPAGSGGPENSGAANPNPSNIFVSGLPGTVQDLKVSIVNFQSKSGNVVNTESLLAGPATAGGTRGLDFFSGTGSASDDFSNETFAFEDSAGGTLGNGALSAGTYKPTSFPQPGQGNDTDSFFASLSGFYTPPSPFSYATTQGSSTLDGIFGDGNANANGTWSLYFNQTVHNDNNPNGGWCLTFTQNPPDIAIQTTSINPSEFTQGGTGSFTYTATNNGPGPTGGTLTLVDTFPTGFSYSSFSGTDWSCTAGSGNVTCTNSDVVTSGNPYPALTITVNVASNASSPRQNSSTISGSMDSCATKCTANDTVTILASPLLSITKSHTDTFTQGGTARWDLSVANQTGSGPTAGTITVTDVLPSGSNHSHPYTYTLNTYSSTGSAWTCTPTGTTTVTVTCTSTTPIAGGGNSNIALTVNIPNTSPTSVNNGASAYGGGDPTHSSSGSQALSNTDTVFGVMQAPASVTVNNSGSPQLAVVNTNFGTALSVTVLDAAGVEIPNYSTVTFTANPGVGGQSGTFSNSSGTISINTNGVGVAGAGTFQANGNLGAYTVTAAAGSASATFNLTNVGLPTFSKAFGTSSIVVGGTTTLTFTISNPAGNATLHNLTFSDGFPGGIAVASTPGASSSCGGTWAPSGGATSVSFFGGTQAAGGPCTISVSIVGTSVTTGAVTNTTGDLSSTETGSTSLTASAQITVNPASQQLTLNVSPSGGGTASPNPTNSTGLPAGNYTPGASVQLTATPNTGYVFSSWSGSADLTSTTANPTSITMNTNETVTANFTGGATSLQMTSSGKSGTEGGSRTWSFTVTNAGSGVALSTQMTSFSLVHVGGPSCTPTVTTSFPLALGTIAPAGTAPASVVINFTGCASTSRFNMTAVLSANSGATTVTVSQNNQYQ